MPAVALLAAGGLAIGWILLEDGRAPRTSATGAAAAADTAAPRPPGRPADAATAPPSEAPRVALPAEPDAPSEAPPPIPPAPRSAPVVVTGSALRVEAGGAEHAGEEGRFDLVVLQGGEREALEVEVHGGRFAFEAAADAVLWIHGLRLGGASVEVEGNPFTIPADRFLAVRGRSLAGILLHAVDAGDEGDEGELDGVEVRSAGSFLHQTTWRHPGAEPTGEPLARGRSPLFVPAAEDVLGQTACWVRAPGYAWAWSVLDFERGGEARVELVRAGALAVELVGYADWLQAEVRLWPPDSAPGDAYAFAKRTPDADHLAVFESLPPGAYAVAVERGWAQDRVSFGSSSVEVTAGSRARVAVQVELPERPPEARVRGELVLADGWEREDVAVAFAAQDEASAWADGPIVVPLAAMEPAGRAVGAWGADRFAFDARLPAPGRWAILARPHEVRRLLEVPVAGLEGVELVVPPPALALVRVVDVESGETVRVDALRWSMPPLEGILATMLWIAPADPGEGRIRIRAPALGIQLHPTTPALVAVEPGQVYELHPGENELELEVRRQLGVRLRFLDGDEELPWSWEWRIEARPVSGDTGAVSRSIGILWFREPGTYELDATVDGYAPVRSQRFDVRPTELDAELPEVPVRLRRE